MDFREVDLETPAGTLADSLAQIFLMTTNSELRQQAYQMVGVDNNRDFALAVEARLNEYFQGKQRKLDRRFTCFSSTLIMTIKDYWFRKAE
uniref:Bm11115, isoform b n=1 Tax=Brugia malayi TaxID=6279 RepID=A0A1I9G5J3_BRUMA|nr:Bm11115, isoform b [Brugia malayi]